MLQCVDTIPNQAGQWFTKRLSFKDRPDEHFTIRHRDPVEAIKALWGDPSFTSDLVYKPAKLFRGQKLAKRSECFPRCGRAGTGMQHK